MCPSPELSEGVAATHLFWQLAGLGLVWMSVGWWIPHVPGAQRFPSEGGSFFLTACPMQKAREGWVGGQGGMWPRLSWEAHSLEQQGLVGPKWSPTPSTGGLAAAPDSSSPLPHPCPPAGPAVLFSGRGLGSFSCKYHASAILHTHASPGPPT